MSSPLLARARTWAENANHAPSGDNSQPWMVALAIECDRVLLDLSLNKETRAAPSIFDCAFSASFLALGAFARNFALMAGSDGYQLTALQEQAGRFILTFSPQRGETTQPSSHETVRLIRRRTTNRLPYKKNPLDDDTRKALARLATDDGLALKEFTGTAKTRLSKLFTALDQIRYRHAGLYLEFLEKLRFGAEAIESPDGLRDKTLGVPAPSLVFLRLLRGLRKVSAVRVIFFIGFERVMALFGCHLLVARSASVFVLSGADDSPLGWFRLGLGFENVWLEATRRELALQPLGTTLLIYRLSRPDQPAVFSTETQARLRELGDCFRNEFGIDLSQPVIAFRVGHGQTIENMSLRQDVRITN